MFKLPIIRKLFVIFFLLLLMPSFPAQAQEKKKVILLLIDQITLDELNAAATPNLDFFISEGAFGLMNTNTSGEKLPGNTYLTIGCGAKAAGGKRAGMGFNLDGTVNEINVEKLFFEQTGIRPHHENVVHLAINDLKKINEAKDYGAVPGLLGSLLHAHGYRIGVYGNSDIPERWGRFGVEIAMDERGVVDGGEVSRKILLVNPEVPFGYETNYSLLLDLFVRDQKKYDLMIFDLGDAARAESYGDLMSLKMLKKYKYEAIINADRFIGKLRQMTEDEKVLFIVAVPTPPPSMVEQGTTLTPLLLWSDDFGHGVLTSGSTKRKGVILNLDILPTILKYLDIPFEDTGSSMRAIEVPEESREYILSLNQLINNIYLQRTPVLVTYVVMQILVIFAAIFVILLNGVVPKFFYRWVNWLLLWITTLPLVFLFISFMQPLTLAANAGLIFLFSTMLAFLIGKLENTLFSFALISLMTVGLLAGDVISGANLIKHSFLGYDPILGARFYGIGNEFMGILIGGTIIGFSCMLEISKGSTVMKNVFLMVAIFLITVLGYPKYGANVGGMITAVFSFGLTYLLLSGQRVSLRKIIVLLLGVIFVLGIMTIIDLSRPLYLQSHLGKLFRSIRDEGSIVFYNIIKRKIAINLKLLRYTKWSKVFISSLIALAILYYRPVGILKKILAKYKDLRNGFLGVAAAAGAGFVFNDSGVVAAATMNTFAITLLLRLILEAKNDIEKE